MSHKHSIGILLEIKDENIKVEEENWLKEEMRNVFRCKVISAKRIYIPKACNCYGCENDGSIVKNGTKLPSTLEYGRIYNLPRV